MHLRREACRLGECNDRCAGEVGDGGCVGDCLSRVDLCYPGVIHSGDERSRILSCTVNQSGELRVVDTATADLRHRVATVLYSVRSKK